MNIKKGSLVQRELTPKAAEGLFYDKFLLLQSLRLATRATSLYTREAYYRQIVTKRSTNKIARTPFVFAVGKTCFIAGTPCVQICYAN